MWSSDRTTTRSFLLVVLSLSLSLFAACAPGQGSIGVCDVDPTAEGCSGAGSTVPGTITSSTDAGPTAATPVADAGIVAPVVADAGGGTTVTATADAGSGTTVTADAGSGTTATTTADAGSTGTTTTTGTTASATTADPTQLPIAATSQVPQPAAYDALNVPGLAAGGSYKDPVSGTKIHKLTSSTFPGVSASWNHDYSDGGDEISLPYKSDGVTRAILVRDASQAYWLIDFTPGAGVTNPRKLTGNGLAPFMDLAWAFSNNPATPYYAYVSDAAAIRRVDIRTMQEAPGNGWPVTGEMWGTWLHQSENDGRFVWMRGGTGSVVVIYEPSTQTKKTYTNTLINEPRMDRSGAFVGMNLNVPANSLAVWEWKSGTITWQTQGDPGIPFAHGASLRGRWMGVDWNGSYPGQFTVFQGAVANSQYGLAGPANGTLVHGSGNWIQHPEDDDDQWAMFDSYDYVRPQPESIGWLSPGGMVLVNANGGRRLLGHEYNTSQNYTMQGFAKTSSDGKFVLFTSNMDGSARSDLFLAEMPAK